ncbi:hypothetical protein M407DRAFT_27427 [Tulasnella calospora MUT 4182]|uniref:Uncharacterized protein n=1 Tax=Tulasnella calospora MUT 4182 TaxID=1051891 RepID=A0A0C3QCH9_9AGAM|nr:hypothetical protein M407DRAFT_27427 [Tulasnella calospora MUT 4182]
MPGDLTATLLGRVAGENASDLTNLSEASDRRVAAELREQADTLRHIKEVQPHSEDLDAQLRTAVDEGQQAFTALKQATPENKRTMRDHALEAGQVPGHKVAEAGDDRAVLERQLAEARTQLEQRSKEISGLKVDLEIRRADQVRVEEDLKALERQKKEQESALKLQVESLKREVKEGRAAIVELRRRMVAQERVTTEIINVATKMRDVNVEAMTNCQNYILGPKHASANTVTVGSTSTGADPLGVGIPLPITSGTSDMLSTSQPPSSASSPPSTPSTIHAASPARSVAANSAGQPAAGPLSPQEALAGLAAFDLEAFTDMINKTGHTIRKWQKQCKEYRDRAKGKIAFQKFQ